MKKISSLLAVIIPSLFCLTCSNDDSKLPKDNWIEVRVDPTVELFFTIHRLAKTGADDNRELPKYVRDIEQYFAPYANHKAVEMARELWENHRINHSALSTLVVYLGDPPELTPLNELNPLPPELDARWTADVVPAFIEAARQFARDTEYMVFFNSQKKLYERSIVNLYNALDDEHMLDWFQAYFGYVPNNYTIIVGMQTGFGNYGASITRGDGTNEFFSIIGANSPFFWNGVPSFRSSWLIPTVAHEFCHPYINPLIAQNEEILREAGSKLFSYNEEKLSKIGCLAWNHMMNEYVVHACVMRYLKSKDYKRLIMQEVRRNEDRGFAGVQGFDDLFEEYEKDRSKYPNMDSFMTRIASYLEQYVTTLD